MRDDGYRPNEFTEKLEKLGYDGVYQGDEFVVFEPNQIKSVENRGSFSPESDNIYYQLGGEHRGRGYVGYSMSVNMAEAQEENRLPASKAAKALGVSTQAIKETIPTSEWHHASSYYNKVDVYDINPYLELKAGKELSTDEYSEEDIAEYKENWEAMKAFPKPDKSVKQFYGDAEWLEWSGSRAHPKAEEHKETGILIEEKGSFYTFYLPNGTTVKKKIGSNGTYVKSEEEKARQKYTDEMYDAKTERLTQISKAYEDEWNSFLAEKGLLKPEFEAFEEYWTESNRDRDNFYIEGQKPYSEYKETGLRRIHKETDDNLNDWYILQEWDGEKWNDLEKREEYKRASFDAEMVPSKKSFLRQHSKDYERLEKTSSAEEIEQELQRQKNGEEQGEVYYQGQIADNAGAVELTINTAEETAGVSEDEFKQKMLDTLKSFKGNKIFNQSLGGEIEIRTSSIKKYKSFFADKNKRLIVPYIPELLAKARFVSENTYTPLTERNIVAYWKADLPINIDSDTYNVHLTVKQDNNGNFFWDAQVQEKAPQTVPATNPGVEGLTSDISEDALNITPLKQNVDRNLVVTHATTLDKLEEALELGAMPMPSLAVTKSEYAGKSNFGEIVFVGGSKIVDPQQDTRNKTFAADIYSTRKVAPTYEINESGEDYIEKQTDNISKKRKYFWKDNISSDLESGTDYNLKRIYLALIGKIKDLDGGTYKIVQEMTDKEKADFAVWKRKFIKEYTNKKIFEGFTAGGKRKFAPYDLKNVLRLMKKENLKASESTAGGNEHALRGVWAEELKSIEEMRKAKGKLADSVDIVCRI